MGRQRCEYRHRQPQELGKEARFDLIMRLRRRGYTYAAIGKVVGLSPNGVKYAMWGVLDPQRYRERCEEEVDHASPPEEW